MSAAPTWSYVLIGILKAGGTYLPLDADYPTDRLSFMLEDARAAVLITDTKLHDRLPACDADIVRVDADRSAIAARPTTALPIRLDQKHAAYVIYTSGSTGTPKGVIGTHGGIVNQILAQSCFDPFRVDDVCCQKTSICFVDSIFEVVGPLTAGACLIVSSAASNDLEALASIIARNKVTRLITVPSLASALVEEIAQNSKVCAPGR